MYSRLDRVIFQLCFGFSFMKKICQNVVDVRNWNALFKWFTTTIAFDTPNKSERFKLINRQCVSACTAVALAMSAHHKSFHFDRDGMFCSSVTDVEKSDYVNVGGFLGRKTWAAVWIICAPRGYYSHDLLSIRFQRHRWLIFKRPIDSVRDLRVASRSPEMIGDLWQRLHRQHDYFPDCIRHKSIS